MVAVRNDVGGADWVGDVMGLVVDQVGAVGLVVDQVGAVVGLVDLVWTLLSLVGKVAYLTLPD